MVVVDCFFGFVVRCLLVACCSRNFLSVEANSLHGFECAMFHFSPCQKAVLTFPCPVTWI